jgi:hypothetical protein
MDTHRPQQPNSHSNTVEFKFTDIKNLTFKFCQVPQNKDIFPQYNYGACLRYGEGVCTDLKGAAYSFQTCS